ncbi:MAG TPA: zf-HC2 domain-containing protein [Longimicrobiales bacterium]|nr:zf-HC2 domain-containing protein [Longimicrobiales bacterium]
MTCQEFLARYSDYLDEQLEPLEAALCRAHMERCPSCARYDRVLRRGLALVRELPQIEPSSDFMPRLQHRLYHVDDDLEMGRRASGASAMVTLAIAGMLAAVAWSPLIRTEPVTVELAPMEARAPAGAEARLRVVPLDEVAERVEAVDPPPGGSWWLTPEPAYPQAVAPAFLGGHVGPMDGVAGELAIPVGVPIGWPEAGARRRTAWAPRVSDPE